MCGGEASHWTEASHHVTFHYIFLFMCGMLFIGVLAKKLAPRIGLPYLEPKYSLNIA